MPNRDMSGPNGLGPLTGRGLGPCGLALRRGFRRGYRWKVIDEPIELDREEEKKILKAEKQEIDKRLKELEE